MYDQFPPYNKYYTSFSTANGLLLTSETDFESLASIYMVNPVGATAPHWLGIVAGIGAAPALGTPLIYAWRNPGAFGFQLQLDQSVLSTISTRGFRLVRSNNPGALTAAPILSNPVDIYVTSKFC